MQKFCRISNLAAIINSPGAPPEIKNLSNIIAGQSKYTEPKPIQPEDSHYFNFLAYLRRKKPSINWMDYNHINIHADPKNITLSKWWIYHNHVHWKNKLFSTSSVNKGNSMICYLDGNRPCIGEITDIFTVADPYKHITGYFLVLNVYKICGGLLSSWPQLDIDQAEISNSKTIITCEEIDSHCALYVHNGVFFFYKTTCIWNRKIIILLHQVPCPQKKRGPLNPLLKNLKSTTFFGGFGKTRHKFSSV